MARIGPKPPKRGGQGQKREDPMSVPYDQWGEELSIESFTDERGNTGYIEDVRRWNYEQDPMPITKKDALSEIKNWEDKTADGWQYGDDDVHIYVTYENGDTMADDELNGKRFKRTGIMGISVSTPDYSLVWGEEWRGSGRNRERVPMTGFYEDPDNGPFYTNTMLGYRNTETWLERVRTEYVPVTRKRYGDEYTAYEPRRTVIRRSTRKRVEW